MNIKEIAELAGVSPATVSRVMNNPELVNQETLRKVREVMEKYNYYSNPFARNIISKKTMNIVMMTPALTNNFLIGLADSGREFLNEQGYMLNLMCSSQSLDRQASILKFLTEKAHHMFMDGLIIAGSASIEKEAVKTIQRIVKVPVVVIEHATSSKKIDTVYADELSGIQLAVNYIKSKGYSDLGVFTAVKKLDFTTRRISYLKEIAAEAGVTIHEDNIIEGNSGSIEYSLEAAGKFFEKKPPQAVYAFNDTTALGLIERAKEKGVRVPEDMAVFCGEYSSYCDVSNPSITSIVWPVKDIGKTAAKLLLRRIAAPNKPIENLILPVSLSIKESC